MMKEGKERKGRIYSLLIMYKVFYILDGDLLNSALLVKKEATVQAVI